MAVSRARQIAFDILLRVEAECAYASELLHAGLGDGLSPLDAGLATEITLGVLRWRRLLDFLLDRHLDKSIERLDLAVAIVLRMGAFQLRFLDRVPSRAAVNESVELVKRARKSSASTLVNAVLRRFVGDAKGPVEPLLPENVDVAERLSIVHSHPAWLVKRWLRRLGERQAEALLRANNLAPPLSCVVNRTADRDAVVREIETTGLRAEPGSLLRQAITVSGGSVARSEAFRSGRVSIQDEASQAIPLLAGIEPGWRALDLCAAPGGKTAALARAAGENGNVIAADLYLNRLRAMREQLRRVGTRNVSLIQLDATERLPFAIEFDAILADAPCSGTGTLARHPEIRWRLRPEQLREFHNLQVRILSRAFGCLRPGGQVVYSTCSLEPEENEEVIAKVLDENASRRHVATKEMAKRLAPYLAPGVFAERFFDSEGRFHIFPGPYGTDGFFAAVITQ